VATPDRVSWRDVAQLFEKEHKQGQHVGVVGPNGTGKSVLLIELAKLRARRRVADGNPSRVSYLAAKPRDKTLDTLGWPIIKKWPPKYGQWHVIVWPPYGDPETVIARHRRVFAPLLRQIFQEGFQTVVIDEVGYFSSRAVDEGLNLGGIIDKYLTVARSSELALFGGTQRPRNVPRSFWSEPKWFGIFRFEDYDDARRVAEIGGKREGLERIITEELQDYEFLFVRRVGAARKELLISKVDL
jgi:energy-coupling factor transporter ATP-binding protein EcfA2